MGEQRSCEHIKRLDVGGELHIIDVETTAVVVFMRLLRPGHCWPSLIQWIRLELKSGCCRASIIDGVQVN